MSEKYEIIKGLGLHVYLNEGSSVAPVVSADDLEALLAKGVRVTGQIEYPQDEIGWSKYSEPSDSHQALLINIQPIPKLEPVSKEELIGTMAALIDTCKIESSVAVGILNRLKAAGVK